MCMIYTSLSRMWEYSSTTDIQYITNHQVSLHYNISRHQVVLHTNDGGPKTVNSLNGLISRRHRSRNFVRLQDSQTSSTTEKSLNYGINCRNGWPIRCWTTALKTSGTTKKASYLSRIWNPSRLQCRLNLQNKDAIDNTQHRKQRRLSYH